MNTKNKKATQIVYSNDFLTHTVGVNNPPQLFSNMTFSAIKSAVKADFKSINECYFDRNSFFKSSDIVPAEKYFFFNKELNFKSKNYLKSCLANKILIGFEFQTKLKEILNECDITYINFWIHPFKLLDDLALSCETNNKAIYDSLLQYQIPREKFVLYGNYWQQRISHTKDFQKLDKNLIANSLLIAGQTEVDKSLEKSGKILSLSDFQIQIDFYKKQYSKIYYQPHPNFYDDRGNPQWKLYPKLKEFLEKNDDIEIINNSTYNLLSSDRIIKVVAISSSVLFEAEFFNKEIEYLYKPLFNCDYKNDMSISLDGQQVFSPKFWADTLQDVCKVNKNAPEIKFDNPQNKCRWLLPEHDQLWWGYKALDNEKLLMKERFRTIKRFKRFPLNLFKFLNPYRS